MPAKRKKTIVGIKWATKKEFSEMVDARARNVLGISAASFISRWESGRYRKLDSDTCPGVIELALLAPLPRSKRARRQDFRKRPSSKFVGFIKETLSIISADFLTAYQQSPKLFKLYYEPYSRIESKDHAFSRSVCHSDFPRNLGDFTIEWSVQGEYTRV